MAGIASQTGYSFDLAEDLKLAVTEACSYLIRQARSETALQVDFDCTPESVSIDVISTTVASDSPREHTGGVAGDRLPDFALDDFDVGLTLVEALMDTTTLSSEDSGRTCLHMTHALNGEGRP